MLYFHNLQFHWGLSLNWTNICHRLNRYRFGQANGDLRYFNLLLIRLIGLPVYAGMSSGFGVLFGPTGGYLIGFIFNGLLTGYILEKQPLTILGPLSQILPVP